MSGEAVSATVLHCDGDVFGCEESHPIDHDCLGEPSFGPGKWLGWIYLDLNRPDLFPRPLRFCSVGCLEYWTHWAKHKKQQLTYIDILLRDNGASQVGEQNVIRAIRERTASRAAPNPPVPRRVGKP